MFRTTRVTDPFSCRTARCADRVQGQWSAAPSGDRSRCDARLETIGGNAERGRRLCFLETRREVVAYLEYSRRSCADPSATKTVSRTFNRLLSSAAIPAKHRITYPIALWCR